MLTQKNYFCNFIIQTFVLQYELLVEQCRIQEENLLGESENFILTEGSWRAWFPRFGVFQPSSSCQASMENTQ